MALAALFVALTLSAASWNPEAQADNLLLQDLSTETALSFDNDNHIWVVNRSPSGLDAYRVDPQGQTKLNTTINTGDIAGFVYHDKCMVVDRWNNLYFTFNINAFSQSGGIGFDRLPYHLVRVTPEGAVKDFFPWPSLSAEVPPYLAIVPDDILYIQGQDESNKKETTYRQIKIKLRRDETKPIQEDVKTSDRLPLALCARDNWQTHYVMWNNDWALLLSKTSSPKTKEDQEGIMFSRTSLDYAGQEMYKTIGTYAWRDYIWRTYHNTWIPDMTIATYKDEGFVVVLCDPKDSTTTHMIRLNLAGEPLNPSELDDGGNRLIKPFDRIPVESKKYAYVSLKSIYESRNASFIDTARVSFWGLDNEGNLYALSKFRTN